MVDYFSNSNPGICDKNGEKNDLKNSINPSLKKQDQILSPEDVASDTLTSLFSETAGCLSNQRYIKTPIIRLSTNQHAASSLIMALVMLFIASMQNRVETNLLNNVEMNMLSMINSKTIHFSSSTLDTFHIMFKCCGAKGNLDWCKNEKFLKGINFKTDQMNSINLLGLYICHIPISCCASSIDEYNSKIMLIIPNTVEYLSSWMFNTIKT
ncbi:uncharacterized protein LOC122635219 [Vespula pensylvanica]|uniref:uncharacterized protein LOC122635219 n=1 Tax=Vespula pensylvanica TaxID=30213 RepID=UPI001CBA4382|nr:uncharacterized protein LOC122635219 [Vespula pensylvanica]